MAIRVLNISSEAYQRHIILLNDKEITLKLRFLPSNAIWIADIETTDFSLYGLKLSVGVLHMKNSNKPFDLIVRDLSNNGLDPFQKDDFSSGRCALYMLSANDMINIRGDAVES